MWTSKQTKLTHNRDSDDSKGERQKLLLYKNPSEKWLHLKFFPWGKWKKNTFGSWPENAQVCVYLCLHALGRVHFQWHSCYMFPASQDIIANGMASAPQNMGQLVFSSLECPCLWDEILVRGLLIEFLSMADVRAFSREMESYRQMIRSHAF